MNGNNLTGFSGIVKWSVKEKSIFSKNLSVQNEAAKKTPRDSCGFSRQPKYRRTGQQRGKGQGEEIAEKELEYKNILRDFHVCFLDKVT